MYRQVYWNIREYTYSRLCFKQITDSKTCVLLKGQTPRNPSLVSRRENLYRVLIHAQVLKRAHISCSRSEGDHHVHREWISVLILFISLIFKPGLFRRKSRFPTPTTRSLGGQIFIISFWKFLTFIDTINQLIWL